MVRKLHCLFRVCAWLEEYEWLTYSPSCGGGYCKYCVLFAKLTKGFLGVLVKSPFKQFNKAKGKDGDI